MQEPAAGLWLGEINSHHFVFYCCDPGVSFLNFGFLMLNPARLMIDKCDVYRLVFRTRGVEVG